MRKIIYICDRCEKDIVRELPAKNIEEKILVVVGDIEVCQECMTTINYIIKK